MKTFIKIILMLLTVGQAFGQESGYVNSVTYLKELLNNQQLEEAKHFVDSIFQGGLKEEEKHAVMGILHVYNKEYGKALNSWSEAKKNVRQTRLICCHTAFATGRMSMLP